MRILQMKLNHKKGACQMTGPYVIIQKLQIKHVCGFRRWCRMVPPNMRHAEENNQKEKRHECNFNETVT